MHVLTQELEVAAATQLALLWAALRAAELDALQSHLGKGEGAVRVSVAAGSRCGCDGMLGFKHGRRCVAGVGTAVGRHSCAACSTSDWPPAMKLAAEMADFWVC